MISFLRVVLITLIENDDHCYKKMVDMVNTFFFLNDGNSSNRSCSIYEVQSNDDSYGNGNDNNDRYE